MPKSLNLFYFKVVCLLLEPPEGGFLYAYLRKSISSNEFALYPKFVYDRKERILSESYESRGEIINEKNDVITG